MLLLHKARDQIVYHQTWKKHCERMDRDWENRLPSRPARQGHEAESSYSSVLVAIFCEIPGYKRPPTPRDPAASATTLHPINQPGAQPLPAVWGRLFS